MRQTLNSQGASTQVGDDLNTMHPSQISAHIADINMPNTARNRGDVVTAPYNLRKRSLEVGLRTVQGSRNQQNLTTGVTKMTNQSRGITPDVETESNMMDTFGASTIS